MIDPLGLTWLQWLAIAGVTVGAVAVGNLAGRGIRAVATRLVRRTRSTLDDAIADRLAGPLGAAVGLAAAAASVPWLELPGDAANGAFRVVKAGYFAVFYWSLFRLVDVAFHVLGETMWARSGPSRALIPLGTRVAKVGVFALALVAVLSYLGYPVASLIAGLGIGGLALALAAQKTVENLFGAFSIGVDQPFRAGDFVRIEDFTATVERVGLRSTRFRTLDRTVVTIPNGRLADSRIESLTARDRMRLATVVGLEYGTSEAQLRAVLAGFERVLRAQPKLFPEGVTVLFRELGSTALNVEVTAWFATEDYGEFQRIRQEVLLQFLRVVEDAGARFAFPTQTVHVVPPPAPRA